MNLRERDSKMAYNNPLPKDLEKLPQRVVTWNVRGLNIPEKRSVLREIHRLRSHNCFLQETHSTAAGRLLLRDTRYPQIYHATFPDTKSKGVSMLIHKSVPWKLEEEWTDGSERLLYINVR